MENNLINEQQLINWRRHLHEYPEVGLQEYKTTNFIIEILESFNCLEILRPCHTGVVACLKGKFDGPSIALRADIDALSMQEIQNDGIPCSKISGVAHTCGHDTHTAMLLEACRILCGYQSLLHGSIYFIFQANEETPPGGAKSIVDSGILNHVEAFYGMHISPGLETGHLYVVEKGAASTASDTFSIKVKGKGTHGSMPHMGVDPIVVSSSIILALQTIISRNIDPNQTAVISLGQIHGGSASNIIPDSVELEGTIRTLDENTRIQIKKRLSEIVKGICDSYGANYELHIEEGYPSVTNDEKLTAHTLEVLSKTFQPAHLHYFTQINASEDFAYYQQIAPSTYFILGAGLKKDGYIYANHNPHFMIDEDALKYGVKYYVSVALEALGVDLNEKN